MSPTEIRKWAWSRWTNCSSPCEGGLQYRFKQGLKLEDYEADGGIQSQTCNTQKCGKYLHIIRTVKYAKLLYLL